ncbi:hypothetical protein [Anaeropeptidivorans aminofermentans]|jgi:uncharacterized membrane protein HdeD (DUF308 family)|uniref:hypothetical protein n=1 Tax=Anaeropeptidivorans aminofermentans TaxID=2934315 RepID=UPI002024342C|nr:hypothetical protein [Anaeropeptidivorans aminofermentans]MBE6011415.1 hypothetical protein [Lachnospiraceae bacterium]
MNKNKSFLILGIVMIISAIFFIIYALNNPQASFPWHNSITYIIYMAYIVLAVSFILKGFKK